MLSRPGFRPQVRGGGPCVRSLGTAVCRGPASQQGSSWEDHQQLGHLHRGCCCEQAWAHGCCRSPGGGKGDVQPDGPPGEGPADRFPVHRAGEAPRIQNGRAASPSGGQQPDTSRRSLACTEGRGERRDQRPTEAQPQAPGPHLASQYRLSRRCRNVHGRLWMGGAAPKTGRKDHSLRAWEASSA